MLGESSPNVWSQAPEARHPGIASCACSVAVPDVHRPPFFRQSARVEIQSNGLWLKPVLVFCGRKPFEPKSLSNTYRADAPASASATLSLQPMTRFACLPTRASTKAAEASAFEPQA